MPGVTTIDDLLAQALVTEAPGNGRLTLAPLFQGFPGSAHGGSVVAAFDRAATPHIGSTTLPRAIDVRIERPIPLDVALRLIHGPSDSGVLLKLAHDDRLLAEGSVTPSERSDAEGPQWDGRRSGGRGWDLPTALGCLACGRENPVGLRVGLSFDEEAVWSCYLPRETFLTAAGRPTPALFTVLLDEIGWWLGALASGEAGGTTEISVALERQGRALDGPLLILGRRDGVTPTDQKGHFWKARAAIFTAAGERLASGGVTFAASRAYSARLIPKMLASNSPESLRRVFPRSV